MLSFRGDCLVGDGDYLVDDREDREGEKTSFVGDWTSFVRGDRLGGWSDMLDYEEEEQECSCCGIVMWDSSSQDGQFGHSLLPVMMEKPH